MNASALLAPFADVVYACDRTFWTAYYDRIRRDVPGAEYWTITDSKAANIVRLHTIDSEKGGGLSSKPHTIRQGGNSGFQALGLALYFGAARVTLLGFDMQFTGGRKHWHGNHARPGSKLHDPKRCNFPHWMAHFALLQKQTAVPIVNATRETALTCFPRVTPEEAFA